MKKDDERMFVEAFAKLRPDLRLSEIRDAERPDFICSVDGNPVGIEVTRFFFPSSGPIPPQAVDGYRQQLAQALCTEHARRRLVPLHVSVHFASDDKLLTSHNRQLLVGLLVNFVEMHVPPEGPHITFDYDSLPSTLLELGVGRILVLRNAALTEPFWSLPYGSFIPASHSSHVQDIVASKSALVSEYLKSVSVLWLLIVSGSAGLHSILDFERDVLTASYTTTFQRLFLFRTFGSSVHELKIA
jgi:hypothetical protein